jgi:hypothetical protein
MEQLDVHFGAQSAPKSAQGQAVDKALDAFSFEEFTDTVRFPPSALRLTRATSISTTQLL